MLAAHRATQLCHEDWKLMQQLAIGMNCIAIKLLALCDFKQHTNQIHAACYKVVSSNPAAAKYVFLFQCLIWE